jgi:hypothetical protein
MAEDTGTQRPKDKPARIARGFVRAGGLIDDQMRRCAGKRGFAQARLRALWPDIAGPEFAAICAPLRLARARGPAGGLLTLAVSGPHAPKLQMLLPLLRERINAALGPGTVGRIQLTQATAQGFAEPPRRFAPAPPPPVELGPVSGTLSSIGDGELRGALETLARNVLSRTRTAGRTARQTTKPSES